ncbi:hypothetical protein CHH27_16390 [Labrenzia sp. VG12]|nr:hypothetical protein CHH27_16390 [Labrenzia sp. VG12]
MTDFTARSKSVSAWAHYNCFAQKVPFVRNGHLGAVLGKILAFVKTLNKLLSKWSQPFDFLFIGNMLHYELRRAVEIGWRPILNLLFDQRSSK